VPTFHVMNYATAALPENKCKNRRNDILARKSAGTLGFGCGALEYVLAPLSGTGDLMKFTKDSLACLLTGFSTSVRKYFAASILCRCNDYLICFVFILCGLLSRSYSEFK